MKSGFVLVNKQEGPTSFDVVRKLRRTLGAKKVGHCGTLDPLADGLLLVAVGNATKFVQYVDNDKKYEFVVCFGKKTDTGDREGKVIEENEHIPVKNQLMSVINNFVGDIMQTPPAYSAIKVDGKRAYELAREGKDVNLKERKVSIFSLELKDFNFKLGLAQFVVHCSNGTYVRSLAEDIAKCCGTVAFCLSIKRTAIGNFKLEDSVLVEDATEKDIIDSTKIIDFPVIQLSDGNYKKIMHGNFIATERYAPNSSMLFFLVYDKEIVALGKTEDKFIKPVLVFDN